MRLAIVSDLHLLHWRRIPSWKHPHVLMAQSIQKEKPDVVINAGDTEQKEWFAKATEGFVSLSTEGNHDYYDLDFSDFDPLHGCHDVTVDGVRFVLAPLWTNYRNNNPLVVNEVQFGMNDYNWIKNFTPEIVYETHLRHLKFITERKADVIVTHHAPSMQSIHPRYRTVRNHMFNYGYASDLDEIVEASGAKLWVHGHTHDEADYMIGNTRVVANPCGYPGERPGRYKPLYVEI